MQNNTTQKVALVNSTTDTLKQSRLTDRTDRAWFSHLLGHPARKQSGYTATLRSWVQYQARAEFIWKISSQRCTQPTYLWWVNWVFTC